MPVPVAVTVPGTVGIPVPVPQGLVDAKGYTVAVALTIGNEVGTTYGGPSGTDVLFSYVQMDVMIVPRSMRERSQ